jgi:hypothetical protein
MALGGQDPAERISEAKQRDGRRQVIADLFRIWWEHHRDLPVPVRQLHDDIKQVLDPQGRSRQYLASQLEKLSGTRLAGFVLTRQASPGKWGSATYALKKTGEAAGHRDHRGHRADGESRDRTDAPYAPDADGRRVINGQAVETSDAPYDAYASADPPRSAPGNNGRPGWRVRL